MKPRLHSILMAALGLAALLLASAPAVFAAAVPAVLPFAETAPMQGRGDVADDTCVWAHSTDGARSIILGINKSDTRFGGLYAFRLSGQPWKKLDTWAPAINWFAPGKKLNNVDICQGVNAGDATWDVVAAANRTDRSVDVFRVATDAQGNFAGLDLLGRVPIGPGFASGTDAPYGMALCCLRPEGRLLAFTSDKQGRVAEYTLSLHPEKTGLARATGERHDLAGKPWQISEQGCEIEGIVADADRQVVYIGSEDEGIFRYALTNGVLDQASKVVVDRVGPRLTADVEGLTMYFAPEGAGYLLASSQGSSRFVVYDRNFSGTQPNAYCASFSLEANGPIDRVRGTDGIDVSSANLGGQLKRGLFIAHDGDGKSPTNYKLAAWQDIEAVLDKERVSNITKPK